MTTYTTAQVAEKFDTDTRTLRKFLRTALEQTPGKGSRYSIEGKDLRSLKSRFKSWGEAQVAAKEVKGEVITSNEVMTAEEADAAAEVDPSDEDLAEIDAEVDA